MRLASLWIKQRKNMLFFQPKFQFFFWKKMRVRPQENFGWKNEKKRGPKKNLFFAPEGFGDSPTSNIIVGHSFDIKIDAPRVWSMSGHYTLATAGRFFKKCQKFCQKMPKNRSWGTLPEAKCCFLRVQQKKFFLETNLICMNFIRLQGLAAGIVSGRNNGLLSCYMELPVRAKTKFSYTSNPTLIAPPLLFLSFFCFFLTFLKNENPQSKKFCYVRYIETSGN